jgi:hypothetical protein
MSQVFAKKLSKIAIVTIVGSKFSSLKSADRLRCSEGGRRPRYDAVRAQILLPQGKPVERNFMDRSSWSMDFQPNATASLERVAHID